MFKMVVDLVGSGVNLVRRMQRGDNMKISVDNV